MKTENKFMNILKINRLMALGLAGVIQLMPVLRAVLPLEARAITPSSWAWVLKIGGGVAALLGSYDAVSGATQIVAPYTVSATVGTAFNRQLTTSGQTAHSWSATTAARGSAVFPLTPGLWLTNRTGRISGTPTSAAVSNITITAWENTGNSGGQVSSVFTFTVTGGSGTAPAITSQPQSRTNNVGTSATFSVTATGTAPLTYQWQFNAAPIAGATTSSYSIASVLAANAGNYSVVVGNSAGSVTSANAALTVLVPATPPSITTQPLSHTNTAGTSATFNVVATGTAPLTYQWQFNAAPIAGATLSSYTIASVQAANVGNYSVVVGNSAGSVTSANAYLAVTAAGTTPSILGQVVDRTNPAAPRFGITFSSNAGQSYRVLYSDNGMATWQAATPAVVAAGTTTQWFDSGPPVTLTPPLLSGNRFYRIVTP